jgi:hypothetical protein
MLMGGLLLVFLGLAGKHVFAQASSPGEYFPETGHWVTNEFLIKYHSVPNPDELFGNPITEAILDELTGWIVQYFEKVRFEFRPEEIPDLRVKISPIGSFLYQKGQTLPGTFNPSTCRFFAEEGAGHYVCYDFLEFFEANGGVPQFGYPISNFEVRENIIVQYFQLACLEWHPENPPGHWVTVSTLGTRYFHLNEPPEIGRPMPNNNSAAFPAPNDIEVHAFVGNPVVPFRGQQTLYVIVQDQNHNPIEKARINFIISYPDGNVQCLQMGYTNNNGISIYNFPVNAKPPGIIEILVTAEYQTFKDQTKTSFQVWW